MRQARLQSFVGRATQELRKVCIGVLQKRLSTVRRLSMSFQVDRLLHASNVLYLFAFMVRDILSLRILTIVAAACLIPYFYFRPEPLMTPIYWNLVFTALNIYWICRLLLERLPVKLSADE